MNSLTSVIILTLTFSARNVDAACPSGILAGPCTSGLCPMGYDCEITSNQCCKLETTTLPSSCVDKLAECPQRVTLCNADSYRAFLMEYCPRTCNFCGITSCSDSDTRCAQWAAQGFCASTFYDTATKQSLCRATCRYC